MARLSHFLGIFADVALSFGNLTEPTSVFFLLAAIRYGSAAIGVDRQWIDKWIDKIHLGSRTGYPTQIDLLVSQLPSSGG